MAEPVEGTVAVRMWRFDLPNDRSVAVGVVPPDSVVAVKLGGQAYVVELSRPVDEHDPEDAGASIVRYRQDGRVFTKMTLPGDAAMGLLSLLAALVDEPLSLGT